jgi:DNA transformation protein
VPVSDGFKEFVRDLLAEFGPVTIRNMFGGAGVYADGVMFAILANDTFYLKADETSARAFADEGMQPFSYQPEGRRPGRHVLLGSAAAPAPSARRKMPASLPWRRWPQ